MGRNQSARGRFLFGSQAIRAGFRLTAIVLIFLPVFSLLSHLGSRQALAVQDYPFIAGWGGPGPGNGQLNYPTAMTFDSTGNLYVADSDNNRIQKFSSTGTYLDKFGSYGTGNGQFHFPAGIAVDSAGNIYVVDRNNHRVQKFNSSGVYQSQWGTQGTGNSQFDYPEGIAVDSADNVYVVDSFNNRVQKFNSSGVYTTEWAGLSRPEGIAVDSSNNVYVADTFGHRIKKFNSAGALLAQWGSGSASSADGSFKYPRGVAVDPSGDIYVADTFNDRLQKLSSTGTFITKWGSLGTGNGQFDFPEGVAVDTAGNVYVADSDNHRIQKFGPAAAGPPTTALTTDPAAPDGDNGWFKISPTVTLTSNGPATTYYRWGASGGWTSYGTAFSAPSGENTLAYYSQSAAGAESAQNRAFKVDTVPPSNPTSITSPSHTINVSSDDSTVDIQFSDATDALSGVGGYAVSWSQGSAQTPSATVTHAAGTGSVTSPSLSDGSWWFNIRTKDQAGNWAGAASVGPYVIETGVPTTVLTTDPPAPNGENGWFKIVPTVTLTPDKPSTTTYYRWGSSGGWTTYSTPFGAPQGQNTLNYYSVSGDKTESTKQQAFKVDTAAPTNPTSISSSSHEANVPSTNQKVTVNLSAAADSVSGVGGYAVSWSQGSAQTPPATVTHAAGAGSVASSNLAEGDWWFNIRTKDQAGSWSGAANIGPFKIYTAAADTTRPTGTININNSAAYTKSTAVKLNLSADDGGSGVASMRFRNGGGSWSAWGAYGATRSWALTSGDGSKRVDAQFKDAAGNESAVVSDLIALDTVAPSAAVQSPAISTDISKTKKFTISWSGADSWPGSGAVGYEVQRKVNSGSWGSWVGWTADAKQAFTGEPGNTYHFRARAKDAAGNIGPWSSAKKTIVPYDDNQLVKGKKGFAHTTLGQSQFYLDTITYSTKKGASISYRFTGNSVALISTKAKNRGRADIYIDGGHVMTVDGFSSVLRPRLRFYTKTWKKSGAHIIRIVNLGTPGRRRFDIDGLAVGR